MTKTRYTTWTREMLASARKVIAALDEHRRLQQTGAPISIDCDAVARITDNDGTLHTIYYDEPTAENIAQAATTPLPPQMEPESHPSHELRGWEGFQRMHYRCVNCAAINLQLLAQPCANVVQK